MTDAANRARDLDRAWFEGHPNRIARVRPAIAGEFDHPAHDFAPVDAGPKPVPEGAAAGDLNAQCDANLQARQIGHAQMTDNGFRFYALVMNTHGNRLRTQLYGSPLSRQYLQNPDDQGLQDAFAQSDGKRSITIDSISPP